MKSLTLFFFFIPFLAFMLILINILLAPHKPYSEKASAFECGFHSFLGQNRSQFNISFFLFGLLFLIFDLEIVLIFPYAVSVNNNLAYGLSIVFIFILVLTAGFIFEIGKKALTLSSKQNDNLLIGINLVLNSSYNIVRCKYHGFDEVSFNKQCLTGKINSSKKEYLRNRFNFKFIKLLLSIIIIFITTKVNVNIVFFFLEIDVKSDFNSIITVIYFIYIAIFKGYLIQLLKSLEENLIFFYFYTLFMLFLLILNYSIPSFVI